MRVYQGPALKSQIQRSSLPKLSHRCLCPSALGRDRPPRGHSLLRAPGICPTGSQGVQAVPKFTALSPASAPPRSGPAINERSVWVPGCAARSGPTAHTRAQRTLHCVSWNHDLPPTPTPPGWTQQAPQPCAPTSQALMLSSASLVALP